MKKNTVGIILIVAGLLLLIGNLGLMEGNLTLIGIGAIFLIAYGSSRKNGKGNLGLLIPGLIVSAVGLFALMEQNLRFVSDRGYLFFAFLGTAFLFIYLIQTRREPNGRWPIYPALGLYGFALFIIAVEFLDSDSVRFLMNNLLPIVIIAVGVVLLVKSSWRSKKSE